MAKGSKSIILDKENQPINTLTFNATSSEAESKVHSIIHESERNTENTLSLTHLNKSNPNDGRRTTTAIVSTS